MEPWQKDVIIRKKSELVELITPGVELLANLESSLLLTSDQLDSLKLYHKTRRVIVEELLGYLMKQKEAYERLRIALEENFQSAAAEILIQGKVYHDEQAEKPLTPRTPVNDVEAENKWKRYNDEKRFCILTEEIRLPSYVFWKQKFYQYLEESSSFQNFVSKNVEQLVDNAYSGELHTAENLLLVIYHSCTGDSKLKGFEKLHAKIQEKQRTWSVDNMTLLFYIGLVLRKSPKEEPLYDKYEQLKCNFPEVMLAINSREYVTIKHQLYQEYLFESKHVETDLRRTLFCWKPKNIVNNGFFHFEAVMQHGQLFFILRCDAFDKGAAVCQSRISWKHMRFIPSSKRWMVTTSPEAPDLSNGTAKVLGEFKWIVEPVGNKKFKLKTWNGKYLYAPNIFFSHDHERRYVFIWKGWHDDLTEKETTWVIETKKAEVLNEEKIKPKFILRERCSYEIQRHWLVVLLIIMLIAWLISKVLSKHAVEIYQHFVKSQHM